MESQHPHTSHKCNLGFSSLSVCPRSSPNSQGSLSSPYRTLELGHPVCGSTHSLPRVSVCPCDLPFPLFPSQGHRFQPNAFLFILPDYMGIIFAALVVKEFFFQVPVSFPWEFFQMYIYFWCVLGRGVISTSFYSGILIPHWRESFSSFSKLFWLFGVFYVSVQILELVLWKMSLVFW